MAERRGVTGTLALVAAALLGVALVASSLIGAGRADAVTPGGEGLAFKVRLPAVGRDSPLAATALPTATSTQAPPARTPPPTQEPPPDPGTGPVYSPGYGPY